MAWKENLADGDFVADAGRAVYDGYCIGCIVLARSKVQRALALCRQVSGRATRAVRLLLLKVQWCAFVIWRTGQNAGSRRKAQALPAV